MITVLFLAATVVVVTAGAALCAGISLDARSVGRFTRETFAPVTRREFWLPPCPFCWAARGLALMLLAVVVLQAS